MEITSTKHPVNQSVISVVKSDNNLSYDRVRVRETTTGNVVLTFTDAYFRNSDTTVKITNGLRQLAINAEITAVPKGIKSKLSITVDSCMYAKVKLQDAISVESLELPVIDEIVPEPVLAESNVYTDGRTDVVISALQTQYGVKVVKNNLKRNLKRFLRTANKVMIRKINITSPYCVATVLVDKKTGAWVIV